MSRGPGTPPGRIFTTLALRSRLARAVGLIVVASEVVELENDPCWLLRQLSGLPNRSPGGDIADTDSEAGHFPSRKSNNKVF